MRPATLIVAFILLVAGPFFYTQSRLRRTGVISSDPAQSVQTAASPISSPSRISSAMFTPKAPPPSTITTAISNPSTPAAAAECSYVSQQAAIEADAFKRDGSSQCWGEKGANRRVRRSSYFCCIKIPQELPTFSISTLIFWQRFRMGRLSMSEPILAVILSECARNYLRTLNGGCWHSSQTPLCASRFWGE